MSKMRVAVIGNSISGLSAAYVLAKEGMVEVVLYEDHNFFTHHSNTFTIDGNPLDIGSMVFYQVMSPNLLELFESLGVDMELSDISFAVSLDEGQGYEWGTRNGLSSLFAQKKNAINPSFWKMIREINKFNIDIINYLEDHKNNPDIDHDETIGEFIQSQGYSDLFQKAYIIPICASMCPCSSEEIMNFSAYSVLSYCRNHHSFQSNIFQPFGRNQQIVVLGNYVNEVKKHLENLGCQIRTKSEVYSVSTNDEGCVVTNKEGLEEKYDGCIIATHAPNALKMLGNQATYDESRILGAFQYRYCDVFLHRDKNLMPKIPAAWSACNYLRTGDNSFYTTFWLDILKTKKNISIEELPLLLSINPPSTPKHTLFKWSTGQPIPSVASSKAKSEFNLIQGKRKLWFTGPYQGFGFHEDELKSGIVAANCLLQRRCEIQYNPRHMVFSWPETWARRLVLMSLQRFIATGCLILYEDSGTVFTFEGTESKCSNKVCLRVHTPQFYWKVAAESDLGLADAYINGDFSVIDKNEGLLNLITMILANMELKTYAPNSKAKRGWWTPFLFTSVIACGKHYLNHALRRNTISQARRNISQHYDLSNELFSLFLDETMAYSSAVFQTEDEDLKSAQLRKYRMLIAKAKIRKEHHVLETGIGWGGLAIEVVKQTGCRYTGITLSKEQLKFAQMKVKEAGLQDRMELLLCDYRELPKSYKYDRILSCEMMECLGHEYVEEYFKCCDSLLAKNGLLVAQTTWISDEKYDEFRLSQGYIKEYIFPGGCMLSLNRMTSAMAKASRLSVVNLEDIGSHYVRTLRCWRDNLLKNQSKILELGFDQKLIRSFEYYMDYCAAGFKACTIGSYHIVFIRPGDVAVCGELYQVSSAH